MKSKTDVTARKLAKIREKFFGPCGHEIYPVKVVQGGARGMNWHCVDCPAYYKKWATKK